MFEIPTHKMKEASRFFSPGPCFPDSLDGESYRETDKRTLITIVECDRYGRLVKLIGFDFYRWTSAARIIEVSSLELLALEAE